MKSFNYITRSFGEAVSLDLGSTTSDTLQLLATEEDCSTSSAVGHDDPERREVYTPEGDEQQAETLTAPAKHQAVRHTVALGRQRLPSAADVKLLSGQKRTVIGDVVDSCVRRCSSADDIEVCPVEEEQQKPQASKKKKHLKKRVRKRAWKLIKTSWKYFKRGMRSYSPGLSAMFTWGINIQNPTSTTYGFGTPTKYL